MKRLITVCLAIVFVFPLIVLPVHLTSASGPPTQEQMLQTVEKTYKIDLKNLKIVSSSSSEYHLTGRKLWHAKVLDNKTGGIFGISMDTDGRVIDDNKAAEEERSAELSKYGKLTPDLVDKLEKIDVNQELTVGIWLEQPAKSFRPDPFEIAKRSEEERQIKRNDWLSNVASNIQTIQAPLLAVLKDHSIPVKYVDTLAPVVYATLSKAMIQNIVLRPDVHEIFLEGNVQPAMKISIPAIRANLLHARGYYGANVKVGVTEVGNFNAFNPRIVGGGEDLRI
ncbi:MAG: hypothetical protein EXR62_07790 [Chloroflexi bacterium]|nr:hypothetical protein [Chloroflexota bacterium]